MASVFFIYKVAVWQCTGAIQVLEMRYTGCFWRVTEREDTGYQRQRVRGWGTYD